MARTLAGKLTGKSKKRLTRHSGRPGTRHSHKYTIGDDDAFITLMEKNTAALDGDARKRLLRAVQDATRRFKASSSKERDAFLHGLVTGYAVAFKLSNRAGEGSDESPATTVQAKGAAAGTLGVA